MSDIITLTIKEINVVNKYMSKKYNTPYKPLDESIKGKFIPMVGGGHKHAVGFKLRGFNTNFSLI